MIENEQKKWQQNHERIPSSFGECRTFFCVCVCVVNHKMKLWEKGKLQKKNQIKGELWLRSNRKRERKNIKNEMEWRKTTKEIIGKRC